jgi:glycosyltransferase involved in cell wall biosynthesis
MRIVHLTNNDFDGVGRAVMRIHRHMIALGIDSQVIVLYKTIYSLDTIALIRVINSAELIVKQRSVWQIIINLIVNYNLLLILKKAILKLINYINVKKQYFFNTHYPLITLKILKAYLDENDVVILYSTQEMLKPEYLREINKISKSPIIIRPMDMEPLTGGCHFNFGCLGYKESCGNCPQLKKTWREDISKRNLRRKINAYSGLNFKVVVANSYSKYIAEESTIFQKKDINLIYMSIESQRCRNIDQNSARDSLSLLLKDKIILFGCFNFDDPRKGAQLLKKALKRVVINIKKNKSSLVSSLHLVTFGQKGNFIFSDLNIKWTHFGQIESSEKMNMLYRSADLLASPSIDDLGPAIVQEAFVNDLPIVAFDLGIAQDLVINSVNGYVVPCFEINSFADSLTKILTERLAATKEQLEQIAKLQNRCTGEYEAKAYYDLVSIKNENI